MWRGCANANRHIICHQPYMTGPCNVLNRRRRMLQLVIQYFVLRYSSKKEQDIIVMIIVYIPNYTNPALILLHGVHRSIDSFDGESSGVLLHSRFTEYGGVTAAAAAAAAAATTPLVSVNAKTHYRLPLVVYIRAVLQGLSLTASLLPSLRAQYKVGGRGPPSTRAAVTVVLHPAHTRSRWSPSTEQHTLNRGSHGPPNTHSIQAVTDHRTHTIHALTVHQTHSIQAVTVH